jgi:hypothetical protein
MMKLFIRTIIGIPRCARNDINAEQACDFIKGYLRSRNGSMPTRFRSGILREEPPLQEQVDRISRIADRIPGITLIGHLSENAIAVWGSRV